MTSTMQALVFIAGLAAISLWLLTALWFFDKYHDRVLLDRAAERSDRQMMLSRIQDPAQAVALHSVHTVQNSAERAHSPNPETVRYDDDKAFFDAVGIGVNPLHEDDDR